MSKRANQFSDGFRTGLTNGVAIAAHAVLDDLAASGKIERPDYSDPALCEPCLLREHGFDELAVIWERAHGVERECYQLNKEGQLVAAKAAEGGKHEPWDGS
jgi:hypothetical protein